MKIIEYRWSNIQGRKIRKFNKLFASDYRTKNVNNYMFINAIIIFVFRWKTLLIPTLYLKYTSYYT